MALVGKLEGGDIGVVIGYFVLVLGVGLWASCRNRGSVGGYFLAGRQMHWIPVGASLFASNIGSGHFIGLAGSGASSGIAIAVFELNAIFILLILGWIFLPVYISTGIFTMPEYLKKRFGGVRIRIYLAVIALLLYIFTKISADLYAGAIFIEQSVQLPLYPSVIILLLFAAVFNILGGLTAVIWTDFIQTVIMLIGASYLMITSFVELGGYENLVTRYFQSLPKTGRYLNFSTFQNPVPNKYFDCGIPDKNAMHFMRSSSDTNLPWPGVIFGLTISSIWYWCTDQVIVQRALAAKNLTFAKSGILLCAWLKMLPMWLIVFPGMASRVLFTDEVACNIPEECKRICGKEKGCSDVAYPKLVLEILPTGARGLMLAVMLASLVSSLTSIFNSASTIFTFDIWQRLRKSASDVELMIVGRVFVLVMVAIGIAWIPIVQSSNELFHYIQSVTSYLSPPICAVYLLALFWKRCNEKGAFIGLMSGLVIGLSRFFTEVAYPPKPCGEENIIPSVLSKVHYLHFGILLFGITLIISVTSSLLTAPMDRRHTDGLLFWNCRKEYSKREVDKGTENPCYENDFEVDAKKYIDVTKGSNLPLPWYRKAINWVCGIEDLKNAKDQPVLTAQELEEIQKLQNSIQEDPKWKLVVNTICLTLITITIFYWGFYA
uniref:Slc5a-2 n=1 Tax=Schmidtea mediterranea TaxID=79327 RepID=A0A0H3YF44_SCHMD|nr:slc5a-2 [Schmidtea mediterranea]